MTDLPYFGGCPICRRTDGYFNSHGPHHWFVCDQHRTKWYIGSNLFSCWKAETPEEQAKAKRKFEGYEIVEPIHPSPAKLAQN